MRPLPRPRAGISRARTFAARTGWGALLAPFPLLASPAWGDVLTGHVYGPGGPTTPGLPDVDVDVFDQVTGVKLVTLDDDTGVGGDFTVVVPPGLYRVAFDPSGAPGPMLAPLQVFDVAVAGTLDMGDLVLAPGIPVTGQVVGPGNAGVADADIDVIDAATGVKMFTPGDDTDLFGFFTFVTEPGTYLVRVQPPVATRLLVGAFGPIAMPAGLDLGQLALAPGVWLSGTITSGSAVPIAGVDVDVKDAFTGAPVAIVEDDTGSSGGYVVVVPTGLFDVRFTPGGSPAAFQSVEATNVVVATDTTLSTLLPSAACGFAAAYGNPTPGAGGLAPSLAANNPAFPGNPWFALEVTAGAGGAPAILALGLGPAAIPIFGGTLFVNPVPLFQTFFFGLGGATGVPGAGTGSVALPIPAVPGLIGGAVYFQEANLDLGAPALFAFSNGLAVTICL